MPRNLVDYTYLRPGHLEVLNDLKVYLDDADKLFAAILQNKIVVLSSQGRSDISDGEGALLKQFQIIRQALYTAATGAWKSLQALTAFAEVLIASLESEEVDPLMLSKRLMRICDGWAKSPLEKSTDSENYEVGLAARSLLYEVSGILAEYGKDFQGIIESMDEVLESGAATDSEISNVPILPNHPLAKTSIFSLFALAANKMFPNSGCHTAVDREFPPWFSGSGVDATAMGGSFTQLVKSDFQQAALLQESVYRHTVAVHDLYTQTKIIDCTLTAIITICTSLSKITNTLRYNVNKFERSLLKAHGSDPIETHFDGPGKEMLKTVWQDALDSIQDVLTALEGKISSSERLDISDIAASYTEFPRAPSSHAQHPENKENRSFLAHTTLQSGKMTSKEVLATFGAPARVATVVTDLSALCDDIMRKLNAFTGLPLAREVKVMNAQGLEVSVFSTVTHLQTCFASMRSSAIDVIMLPLLNEDGHDSIEKLIANNRQYLQYFPTEVESTINKSIRLEKEYKSTLDLMGEGIAELQRQARDQIIQVANEKGGWAEHVVQTYLEKTLTSVFIIGTGVSRASGVGSMAAIALGIEAGKSINTVVHEAVKAGNAKRLIQDAKDLLAQTKHTYDALAELVPLLGRFSNQFGKISQIWGTLALLMRAIESDLLKWKDPNNFTLELTRPAVLSWDGVEGACKSLIVQQTSVNAVIPNSSANKTDLSPQTIGRNVLQTYANNSAVTESVPVHSFKRLATIKVLSAPDVYFGGLRYNSIVYFGASWGNLANELRTVGLGSTADLAQQISKQIQGPILNDMYKAFQGIYRYSQMKIGIPKNLYDPRKLKDWETFWFHKDDAIHAGKTQTWACGNNLKSFQFTSGELNNEVIRVTSETQQRIRELRRELAELKQQHEEQRGGWIINETASFFNDKEAKLMDQINGISNSLNTLAQVGDALRGFTDNTQTLASCIASLGMFWNELSSDSGTLASVWESLVEYPEDEISIAMRTWESLESQVRMFKPDSFPA